MEAFLGVKFPKEQIKTDTTDISISHDQYITNTFELENKDCYL